jgi:uncharacterized alkaline shock family protein YloU
MSADAGRDRLSCGRPAEDVLDQVAAGRAAERDAHQTRCPHCQAALAEYDRLWAPVRELAVEQVHPPESLVDSAMRRIRGAMQDPEYGVLDSTHGRTRIAARVVVVAARESAQAVPGVRVALSKHILTRDGSQGTLAAGSISGPEVSVGVAGRSAAIEITLAADYGTDLRRLGEEVRAAVAFRVRALTDLEPIGVTVIIDDILD